MSGYEVLAACVGGLVMLHLIGVGIIIVKAIRDQKGR